MKISTEPQGLDHVSTTLAEVSRELAAWVPVLRQLAEAEVLRNLARGDSFEITPAAVRSIIRSRRLRDEYFWPGMSESAWDVLLHLLASRLEGQRLDVAGLSAATGHTLDSAQHWVDWMAGRGTISRKYGEAEAATIDLTEDSVDRMRSYLLASLSLSPWAQ